MKMSAFAIALIASSVATSAIADDGPYPFRGYRPGKNVAGRTYCANTEVLTFQGFGQNKTTGKIAARDEITFGWSGEMRIKVLSLGANLSISVAGPIITFVDAEEREDRTGAYSQTGSRLDVVLHGEAGEDVPANWYVSGDGSMIQGTATRRITIDDEGATQGQTWSWTLIEGADCVPEPAFPPFD